MTKTKSPFCLSLVLCFLLTQTLCVSKSSKGCIRNERAALLSFKEGLKDPGNRLSTWRGEACCAWWGVTCNNKTGHVVRLDLRNEDNLQLDYGLSGKISSSLVALRHLNVLDLSRNLFDEIPPFIRSMRSLRYLYLSGTGFGGNIPPQLGNLSNLLYLDLNNIEHGWNMYSNDDLTWLSRLSLLEHLDMSGVDLSTNSNWAQIMSMLSSIKSISLIASYFQNPTSSLVLSNLSNLVALDISFNNLGDLTSLNWVRNLTTLKSLDLSGNYFEGVLSPTFNNLCNMQELDLSYNYDMNIDITEFIHSLPQCIRSKLHSLNLDSTNLVGNLSSILEQMTSLKTLDLSNNNLNGPIPYIIRATRLSYLDLSNNLLDTVVSKDHFANLMSLQSLFLDGNSLLVEQNWDPPIALRRVTFSSCGLGPKFPLWLIRLSNIIYLDMFNTSIIDKMPNWFWNLSSNLIFLDISNNQISSNIHKTLQFTPLIELYLQNNLFEGSMPLLPQNLTSLDLSNNFLSGPLPLNFETPHLISLFLHDNLLSGTIPASICQLISLQFIDLSNNLLIGPLPMCWLDTNFTMDLKVLILRNNNFISHIFPSFLRNCQNLRFLDLSYNKFSGNLPQWVGDKLFWLQFLLLRSNRFFGDLPIQITELNLLQVLDLGYNNFSGTIPPSVYAFNGMIRYNASSDPLYFRSSTYSVFLRIDILNVVTKGSTLMYSTYLSMASIDLSSNSIAGEIPEGITSLIGLRI